MDPLSFGVPQEVPNADEPLEALETLQILETLRPSRARSQKLADRKARGGVHARVSGLWCLREVQGVVALGLKVASLQLLSVGYYGLGCSPLY